MRLVPINMGTLKLVESSPKITLLESRYLHFVQRHVIPANVALSSLLSNRKHAGLSVSKQLVYIIVFGLKRA